MLLHFHPPQINPSVFDKSLTTIMTERKWWPTDWQRQLFGGSGGGEDDDDDVEEKEEETGLFQIHAGLETRLTLNKPLPYCCVRCACR